MTSSPQRVTVVGGGIVGLSTAWHLQDEGLDVTIVDRTGIAAGSSWGNAGWLSPALTLPLAEPAVLATGLRALLTPSSPLYIPMSSDVRLLRFLAGFARQCTPGRWREAMRIYAEINQHSLAAYEQIVGNDSAGATVHDAEPFLAAFTTREDRDALERELAHVRALGTDVDYTVLDEQQTRTLEPALGDAVQAGIRMNGQRFVNPGQFIDHLASSVQERGATFRFGSAATHLDDCTVHGVRVHLEDGSTVPGDAVVVATGAWLGELTRPFGVRTLVQAGRGYSFTVQPDSMPQNPIYFPAQRVACTPLHPGLRVAGMMEFRRPDALLDPRRIDAIVQAARPMLTGVDWNARTSEWVGSRPCTSDGLPLIGATNSPRVHVAGGHGMWGMVLGPFTGQILAKSIVRGERHELMRHFDPLR